MVESVGSVTVTVLGGRCKPVLGAGLLNVAMTVRPSARPFATEPTLKARASARRSTRSRFFFPFLDPDGERGQAAPLVCAPISALSSSNHPCPSVRSSSRTRSWTRRAGVPSGGRSLSRGHRGCRDRWPPASSVAPAAAEAFQSTTAPHRWTVGARSSVGCPRSMAQGGGDAARGGRARARRQAR